MRRSFELYSLDGDYPVHQLVYITNVITQIINFVSYALNPSVRRLAYACAICFHPFPSVIDSGHLKPMTLL